MLLSSVSEIISLGAVVPFLSVLVAPEFIFENKSAKILIDLFNISSPQELVLPITIFFIIVTICSGLMRLFFLRLSLNLAYSTGADFTSKAYELTLLQPYSVHISRNSSEVINVVVSKVNSTINGTLMPALVLLGSSFLILVSFAFLVYIQPYATIFAILLFGIIYFVIMILSKNKLLSNGKVMSVEHNRVIKLLQEGMGGIRDVIINSTQSYYSSRYRKSDKKLRNAQALNMFIASYPRYLIETIGIILLSFGAYLLINNSNGIIDYIPIIGLLAVSAQRLLPEIQKIFSSWALLNGSKANVTDTLKFLNQSKPVSNNDINYHLPFQNEIFIKDVFFKYSNSDPWVLKGINFSIKKGERIGIIGSTGGGKSTLTDIILCLLKPSKGEILIDKNPLSLSNYASWQKNIAHVPQTIFLSDGDITENIAFGIDKNKIDHKLVEDCARRSSLLSSIESWPRKFNTIVGERGVKLSGGQRQRIGIARALYKKANVFVFDEATNALDTKTEDDVINSIYNLGSELTIIMIAHRLSTLKGCSKIIRIDKGVISKIGNYKEMVVKSKS